MQDLIKVTNQVASVFHRRNPSLEKAEVTAEANLAMIEAINTFDPEKGRNLKSWVGFMVHRSLRKTFQFQVEHLQYIDDLSCSRALDPERIYILKETINSFSKAAKEVITIILQNPVSRKSEIKSQLRKQGFAFNKIQTAFTELRRFANSMG